MSKKKYGIISLLAMALICVTLFGASSMVFAQGHGNGYHRNIDNSKTSNVLAIGDSRMSGVAGANLKKFSYNTIVGGKYSNTKSSLYIGQYLSQQKAIVQKILKKHKKAIVIIGGTVNDDKSAFRYPEIGMKASVNNMDSIAKSLKKLAVKGQSVEVYYTSAIPEKNKDGEVKRLNELIKKSIGSKHYISLGYTSDWKKYYGGDKLHFNDAGSKLYYKKLLSGISASKPIVK